MTNREKSSFLGRTLLRGAAAGAASGLLCLAVLQTAVLLTPPSPDANIGLGLFVFTAAPLLAGLLVWPLLRLLDVPAAGLSALLAVPLYVFAASLLLSSEPLLNAPFPEDGMKATVWNTVALGVLPMAAATAAAVLCVHRLPRLFRSRRG